MAVAVPTSAAIAKVLQNRNSVPMVGLGLGAWLSADNAETLEETTEMALIAGYKHFDTSPPNDQSVGKVLKKWIDAAKIKREELFIVSKLPMTAMWPYRVNEFLREALKSLELEYVDLYLIQFPVGFQPSNYPQAVNILPGDQDGNIILEKTNLEPIWKAMENEVKVGRAKSIGICDFNQEQIERILNMCTIPPAVLQTEVNAYYQQKQMREFCSIKNIAVCAYAPLGTSDITDIDLESSSDDAGRLNVTRDPAVKALARKYGKTPGQILLRFLVQSDVIVVPKCLNAFDLMAGIKVYGFELEEGDMKILEGLDKGNDGHLALGVFSEMFTGVTNHPEYPWTDKPE